jgi:Mat/Ecp fimbriae major subunit
MKKFALLAAAATMAFGTSSAQAATASADATATILQQITVTKVSDLAFGTIVVGATGGAVTVSNSGAAISCGATLACSGTNNAASFNVVGTVGEVVTVTVDPTVTLNSGANSMLATLNPSYSGAHTLTAADVLRVGGTLAVAPNQASGVYSGTFNVTVNY